MKIAAQSSDENGARKASNGTSRSLDIPSSPTPEKKNGVAKSTAVARIDVTEKGAKDMWAEPETIAPISPFQLPLFCERHYRNWNWGNVRKFNKSSKKAFYISGPESAVRDEKEVDFEFEFACDGCEEVHCQAVAARQSVRGCGRRRGGG